LEVDVHNGRINFTPDDRSRSCGWLAGCGLGRVCSSIWTVGVRNLLDGGFIVDWEARSLGWTFALYLHIGTGIRHLLMDSGYLLSIPQATRAGQVIIASSVILTAATWLCVLTCTASN
jgi:hypothetical protein